MKVSWMFLALIPFLSLSEEAFAGYAKPFKRLDANEDGILTMKEYEEGKIKSVVRHYSPRLKSSAWLKDWVHRLAKVFFKVSDTNGDGKLTLKEIDANEGKERRCAFGPLSVQLTNRVYNGREKFNSRKCA